VATRTPDARLSYGKYLALEESSGIKHEYIRGDVYAMSRGTPMHASLQVAVSTAVRVALRGRPCQVFSSDLAVRVDATDSTFHPDVTVVCGKLETSPTDANAVVNPKLIVEVLSESTEAYDRGAKASHYRQLPSLAEYVLVSQAERLVEVHRKNERGRWELAVEARDGEVELASVEVRFTIDEIYANPLES
jgi:Uma2 family endonuclease